MTIDTDERVGPTKERLRLAGQHVEEEVVTETTTDERGRESSHTFLRYRLTDGSPLEALASLGRKAPLKGIDGEQYQAGVRYFESAFLAGVLASGVPDLLQERVDGGSHRGIADVRLEAANRYAMALKAIDRMSAAILHHVVLMERPMHTFIEVSEFPQMRERRAISLKLLRIALDQLVKHYEKAAGIPPRKPRIEVMHEPEYRPHILKGGAADDR